MPIPEGELRAWTRDFLTALNQPEERSLVALFFGTIERPPNEQLRQVLAAVRDDLAAGHPLSSALSRHPEVFDAKYVTIARYGEIYGEVDVTLERYLNRPEEMQPRCRMRPQKSNPSSQVKT